MRVAASFAVIVGLVAFGGAAASCGFDGRGEGSIAPGAFGAGGAGGDDAVEGGSQATPSVNDAAVGLGLDAALPDGALASGAPFVCPAACTGGCAAGKCLITCTGGTPCAKVTCPPGLPCVVDCTGNNACTNGVDCSQASSCAVNCDTSANPQDPGACHNVDCGGVSCTITCSGEKACQQRLSCTGATQCVFDCKTKSSCCAAPMCSGPCTIGGNVQGVGGC